MSKRDGVRAAAAHLGGLFGLALVLAGCGDGRPDLVEATGTVNLDGQPVEGAIVVFQPLGEGDYKRPSRATTDAAGKFSIGTYGKGDGIPEGEYAVGVEKREVVGELPDNFNWENPGAFNVRYKWTTPRKYSVPAESGLKVEVTSDGLEPAVIALESGGQPPEIELTGPQSRANEP